MRESYDPHLSTSLG
ncbi:Protein of unknown function [Propionibacterium freudenreichii]|nr:Protein of unknown function [Propionibacterium freudenreichii]